MPPSSTTPNFSRPLPSPLALSTGAIDSSTRGSRNYGALSDHPHSAALPNMPHGTLTEDLSPSKRLFASPTNSPVAHKLAESEEKHAGNALSPTKRYNKNMPKSSLKSPSKSQVTGPRYAILLTHHLSHQLWAHNRSASTLELSTSPSSTSVLTYGITLTENARRSTLTCSGRSTLRLSKTRKMQKTPTAIPRVFSHSKTSTLSKPSTTYTTCN